MTVLKGKFNHISKTLESVIFFWWLSAGLPDGSAVKNPPANAGDMGSVPGPERSPGEGNGNPFQYSCLGNPIDREAWPATIHEVAKESDTT